MRFSSFFAIGVALATLVPVAASAQSVASLSSASAPAQPAAKRRYSLFNPTPWEVARDLSTDRPDLTESPYTVPAGRFQFEFDLVNYTRDVSGTGTARTRIESLAIAPVNMKVGLVHNVDLQVVVETFVRDRERQLSSTGGVSSSRLGEITGRLKVNFWGNDGGKTAFGIMPFAAFVPNGAGGRYLNGGVIIPLAIDLGGGFGMGTMAEIDFEKNETTGRYNTVFINTVTVGRDLSESLGAYAEFFSGASTLRGAGWAGSVDFGMTRAFGPNVQLDLGANIGVSQAADGFNPFLGLSFRF